MASSALQIYEVDAIRIRITRKEADVDQDDHGFDDRVLETVSIEALDEEGNEIAHISLINHDPQPMIVVTFDDER